MGIRGAKPSGPDLTKRKLHEPPNSSAHSANDTASLSHSAVGVDFESLDAGCIIPPRQLSKIQKQAFTQIRDIVIEMGIATISDRFALYTLCMIYASYTELNEQIAKDGLIQEYDGDNGKTILKAHPLLSERSRVFVQLRQLLTEFGMTPNSRRALMQLNPNAAANNEDDAWDAALGK